ncbi:MULTISPECIES: FecR family protein [unclassified Afipia]|uniref:FecR family protein n=1 Tax=unclassified Afipia TaxID=2642050 RepID=UPI0003FA7C1E|nr:MULTISPECIES: FecR family protein [unclassified Afipia]
MRSALLVASMLCGLAVAPAHAEQIIQLAQATPAQPASPAPAPADSSAPPAQAGQPPSADQPATDTEEPAGNVATLKGTATVTRNGMTGPLKLQDDIFKGDVLQTGKNSTLGVTFSDDTTLNLSASSRVAVDNFVYQEGAKDNAALLNVTRGTMAFVAAAVAKTGDMKIETPTATLGIRGTTGVVEVPERATATAANASNVGIKLYPDADGKVGRIEVRARDGAPLGMLTQAASGFTVRGTMVPGFGMRMSAMPMVMSAQMIARDRGFMQRVHTMQGIGRNIVLQQRNFRMQNPNRPPAFGRPGFNPNAPQRGGLNQPGQRPGLNQPGQRGGLNQNQPGLNNRPGQPNQPGLRNQPGQPNRPGLNQPGQPGRPGLQNPPGQRGNLQPGTGQPGRPGLPNQGGLQRPPGAPPNGFQRTPGAPGQLGSRPPLPNQPGLARPGIQQPGVPGGFQRPTASPSAPGLQGPAGILNRLGVPNRLGIPQVPSAVPRPGQPAVPALQKKLPQTPKDKPLPKELLR